MGEDIKSVTAADILAYELNTVLSFSGKQTYANALCPLYSHDQIFGSMYLNIKARHINIPVLIVQFWKEDDFDKNGILNPAVEINCAVNILCFNNGKEPGDKEFKENIIIFQMYKDEDNNNLVHLREASSINEVIEIYKKAYKINLREVTRIKCDDELFPKEIDPEAMPLKFKNMVIFMIKMQMALQKSRVRDRVK